LLPEDYALTPIAKADALRDEISAQLGEDMSRTWLTIDFTGSRNWL
jgi:predicted Co/Zn/Cd cation transporter (cation efflux family)